jgi:subtilisin-like proprotein convertase family protein
MNALRAVALACALAVVGSSAATASAATYANTTPITIVDNAASSPYGTSIPVANVPGLVTRVGVELVGAEHGFAGDVRALLVSPAGRAMVLNRQGFNALSAGDLRIDTDSEAKTFSEIPDPGVHAIEPDRAPGASMPGPAPAAPYGGSLRPLIGGSPNGTWTLYVSDASAGAAGAISGGWRLHLDTTINDRLRGAPSNASSTPAVEGGAVASVQLLRETTGAPLGALDLRVRTIDGTAKAGEDFVATDTIVHFPSGANQAFFDVPLLNDDVAEGAEAFSLEYVGLPSGITGVEPPTDPDGSVIVLDDDGPAGLYAKFQFPRHRVREGGGSGGTFTVIRTGSLADPLTVTWEALVNGADVQLPPPTPLPGGGTNRFFGLSMPTAVDDALDESPTEVASLFLKANGNFVASTPVDVLDDEGPAVMSLREGNDALEGGAGGQVGIFREGGVKGNETVTVTLASGTAVQGPDYSAVNGSSAASVFSGADVSGRNLSLGVVDDAQFEGNKEVRVTISSPTVSALDSSRSGVNVPVVDNDVPAGYGGELKPGFAQATEGTVVRIPVNRIGPAGAAVSANWSTRNVTAVAGRDYESASGTVAWAAGDATPKEIQVVTLQDGLVEGDERVGVVLDTLTTSDPSKTIGLAPAAVDGRIVDDDLTGPGQLDLDAGALTVTEGEPIVVPVHRTLGSAGAVEVTCRVADGVGTATEGEDIAPSATATFADAATEGTCTLATTGDALDEPDETLRVELADPTGGAIIGPSSAREVTITDDDAPASGPIRLGAAEVTVAESVGTVPITVDRGPGTTGDVNALLTLQPGTAGAGDATLSPSRVTIPAGQASATATLTVVDDTADEVDAEDLAVVLSDPQGGAALGTPSTQRVVITDDDGPGVASIVDGTRALQLLENAGSARLVVRRQFGLNAGAGFSWSFVPGTAGGRDVGARSGSVVFGAGQLEATISVPIVNDRLLERNETFRILLSDTVGGLSLTAPTSRAVTILDNDGFAAIRVLTRRARLDRRNRARVRLACPKVGRRACVGRLSLARGKGKKAVALGSVRYKLKPSSARAVRVRIGRRGLAVLPRGRTTRVTLRARATSRAVRLVVRRLQLRR